MARLRSFLQTMAPHFASSVIAGLCRSDIRFVALMSTPYTPQSNGIVERFMGYFKNALIALVDQKPKTWDTHLSAILCSHIEQRRILKLESHPFFMNKGYDPIVPEMRALVFATGTACFPVSWHEALVSARTTLETDSRCNSKRSWQLEISQQKGQRFRSRAAGPSEENASRAAKTPYEAS